MKDFTGEIGWLRIHCEAFNWYEERIIQKVVDSLTAANCLLVHDISYPNLAEKNIALMKINNEVIDFIRGRNVINPQA